MGSDPKWEEYTVENDFIVCIMLFSTVLYLYNIIIYREREYTKSCLALHAVRVVVYLYICTFEPSARNANFD